MLSSRKLLALLLAPYAFALAAVAGSFYVYGDAAVENLYLDTLSETILRQARVAGELLPWDARGEALDRRCAQLAAQVGARVTAIGSDGTVLGDSDAPSAGLENHGDRPEVRAAVRDGEGQSARWSDSVNRQMFYRAWLQSRDGEQRVIRLAVPMAAIDSTRARIRGAIWGGVGVAALAALWPALALSRRLSRRLGHLAEFSSAVAGGATPPALVPAGTDIVGRLEVNLTAMADTLREQLKAARGEKEKLEAVLGGMVEGVMVIDRAGVIRLTNRCVERIFGALSGESLVGRPLLSVSRDPDLQELVRALARGEAAPPLVRELALGGRGGEMLRVTATAIGPGGADSELLILVFHDITALKKLEATRRDFVANVSHELRTPLTAIRGYAEALRSGAIDDPERAARFVGVIERHSERLGRLIDDLLTLSDLELGRTALRRTAVSVGACVEAAMDVVREKARQGGVELRCEMDAGVPCLDADPDRVVQVLLNLVDNAVKYTPGGGRVTIGARACGAPERGTDAGSASERWVEIVVADTGIGVPGKDLPRLTERFYRVDKARSRALGGTGLGLAIVKHIVHAHGGTMHIESQVGRGTSVFVYLPAAGKEGVDLR